MSQFLVTIDPIAGGAEVQTLVENIARATRKPAADWMRTLAAPGLARPLFTASGEAEAKDMAARYAQLGLGTHVIATHEVTQALDDVFEATWAERLRDGLMCIAADGQELELVSSDIRSLATGQQIAQGQRQYFLVVGLRTKHTALILRFPGSDVSKLVRAQTNAEELEGALATFARIAPHARIERGLDEIAGKLPMLSLVGTTDLAHAGVISAALVRRFPPPPPKEAVRPAPGADAPAAPSIGIAERYPGEQARGRFGQPVVQQKALELDTTASSAARADRLDNSAAMQALDALAANSSRAPTGFSAGGPGGMSGAPARAGLARRVAIIGVIALVAAAAAFVVLRKPSEQQRVVKRGDTWESAYGVSFTYSAPYDASVAGIMNPGFVVDVKRGLAGETTTVRVPSHEAKLDRDADGVLWHVESYDALGAAAGGADWIVINAKPRK